MLSTETRMKRKNEKLEKEIAELKKENYELRSQMMFFNERLKIVNEKEQAYNEMLAELEKLKVYYRKVIQDAKDIKKKITKEINKYK